MLNFFFYITNTHIHFLQCIWFGLLHNKFTEEVMGSVSVVLFLECGLEPHTCTVEINTYSTLTVFQNYQYSLLPYRSYQYVKNNPEVWQYWSRFLGNPFTLSLGIYAAAYKAKVWFRWSTNLFTVSLDDILRYLEVIHCSLTVKHHNMEFLTWNGNKHWVCFPSLAGICHTVGTDFLGNKLLSISSL